MTSYFPTIVITSGMNENVMVQGCCVVVEEQKHVPSVIFDLTIMQRPL